MKPGAPSLSHCTIALLPPERVQLPPTLFQNDRRGLQVIELKVSAAGGVTWEAADEAQLSSTGGEAKQPKKAMKVAVPKWCGKWALGMDAYKDGVVGAKSKNIAGKPWLF